MSNGIIYLDGMALDRNGFLSLIKVDKSGQMVEQHCPKSRTEKCGLYCANLQLQHSDLIGSDSNNYVDIYTCKHHIMVVGNKCKYI